MHASTEKTSPLSPTADREIVLTRVFDAPRDLVFEAWTDPRHLAHWWGPNGFTITTHSFDMKPGGDWRFIMHGPDGRDYKNHVVFIEIAKPERLVYKHVPEKGTEFVGFETTVTFTDDGGKTSVTMHVVLPSAAALEHVVKNYGAIEGGKQTLARLGEYVAKLAAGFSISRVFDAPRDLVWKAFTEPDRLVHWWGPTGFALQVLKLDLRPGGMFIYGMRSASGYEMWGRFVYREIAPPERVVFVLSFCDVAGNIVRAPMSATWPLETLNTMTFSEHNGKTTLALFAIPINATEEEQRTFEAGHDSMRQGFGATFDQLDTYLAKA